MLDREWMVVSELGALLTQKQEPKLSLIHPKINLETSTLTLTSEGIICNGMSTDVAQCYLYCSEVVMECS